VVTHDTRLAERMERIYEIEKGSLSERLTSPLRRGEPYTGT
jgi:ABC-type lipoprotein export system ATPase subunit